MVKQLKCPWITSTVNFAIGGLFLSAQPKEVPPPSEGPKLKSKWGTHPKSHFTRNEYQMVPEKVGPNNSPKISPCVVRTLKKRNHTFWLQNHHKCSQRLQRCTHASLEVTPSQRKQRVGESLGGNGLHGRPVSSTHQPYITPHSPIHMCVSTLVFPILQPVVLDLGWSPDVVEPLPARHLWGTAKGSQNG